MGWELGRRLMRKWAQTDVDCLQMMDDWGSQKSLLISPKLWRQYFGPMYKDYIDIAHNAGKKISMHSDGYTLDILPDLIEKSDIHLVIQKAVHL